MIRVGIVGCGRILNAHLQGWKVLREAGFDDFRITALVARKADDARSFLSRDSGPEPRLIVLPPESGDPLAAAQAFLSDFQESGDVQVYTDYRDMLDNAPVDGVNDYTTLSMHHLIGAASLQAGKHLLTQKPFTITVKAGKLLVDLAREKRLALGVHEVVRNRLPTRAARWAVERGLIGRPQFAITGYLGGPWSPDRIVAETPWRHRKLEAGGGSTLDLGVHQFHWLRYVVGQVAWVSAVAPTFEEHRYTRDAEGKVLESLRNDVDDTHIGLVGFENGAVGQLMWSWSMHGEPLKIDGAPAVYGSEGCIKGDALIHDDGSRETLSAKFNAELGSDERERFFPGGVTDPFGLQQLEWLRAIKEGRDPETSGQVGLEDLACAYAMVEANRLGRRVAPGEVLSGRLSGYQDEIDAHYGL